MTQVDIFGAARIRELIALQTRPQGWEGDEPIATTVMDVAYQNGAVEPRFFSEGER